MTSFRLFRPCFRLVCIISSRSSLPDTASQTWLRSRPYCKRMLRISKSPTPNGVHTGKHFSIRASSTKCEDRQSTINIPRYSALNQYTDHREARRPWTPRVCTHSLILQVVVPGSRAGLCYLNIPFIVLSSQSSVIGFPAAAAGRTVPFSPGWFV